MRFTFARLATCALIATGSLVASASAAPAPGPGEDIRIGTVLDLSGPVTQISQLLRAGMEAEIETINAAGGIHGRKLRLLVEDSGYDTKRAIIATRKLIQQDQVFALASVLGAAISRAVMPMSIEADVPFLFPAAPIDDIFTPVKKLAFSYNGSYARGFETATRYAYQTLGKRRFCVIHQDDEGGEQIYGGVVAGLKQVQAQVVERTTYKRGAIDFSSQFARMKEAGCDIVMAGVTAREGSIAAAERQKIQWDVTMIVSQPSSVGTFVQLAGKAAEGVYGMITWVPLDDLRNRPKIAQMIKKYEETAKKPFDDVLLSGHQLIAMIAEGLRRAGPALTTDKFVAGLESLKDFDPGFGFPPMSFSPTQRLGSSTMYLVQVREATWRTVTPMN